MTRPSRDQVEWVVVLLALLFAAGVLGGVVVGADRVAWWRDR